MGFKGISEGISEGSMFGVNFCSSLVGHAIVVNRVLVMRVHLHQDNICVLENMVIMKLKVTRINWVVEDDRRLLALLARLPFTSM